MKVLKANEEMIESNLGLVYAVARTYRGRGVPFEDLVQEGTIGLVSAVERFDHDRGVKFSTYAMWWIRRAILDAMASSQVIRMPAKPANSWPPCDVPSQSSNGSAAGALQTKRSRSAPSSAPRRCDRCVPRLA